MRICNGKQQAMSLAGANKLTMLLAVGILIGTIGTLNAATRASPPPSVASPTTPPTGEATPSSPCAPDDSSPSDTPPIGEATPSSPCAPHDSSPSDTSPTGEATPSSPCAPDDSSPSAPTGEATSSSPQSLVIDRVNHSVTLTVTSTDCGLDTPLEFLLVGPGSDRDYEAMFVTDASPTDIARAFVSAGIGNLGSCYDPAKCIFWPTGQEVSMEPAFTNLVRQMREEKLPQILWTSGTRDPKTRIPEAATNMPCAVFALYNCGQSLLQFNDSLDQSVTYGRFQPAVKIPKGEKRTITFKQKDVPLCRTIHTEWKPGTSLSLSRSMTWFKEQSEKYELELRMSFAPELTLKEAKDIATAMAMIDSVRVKINGFKEGDFYYRAYLPLEKWRDRHERLAQPPEVHFKKDGSLTVVQVLEDWSDPDSLDPKLTVKEHPCATPDDAAKLVGELIGKTMTVLLYADPDEKLARLQTFKKLVTAEVPNWYIFTE